eukprot:5316462-Alexandrium_andersonii.AAC.1
MCIRDSPRGGRAPLAPSPSIQHYYLPLRSSHVLHCTLLVFGLGDLVRMLLGELDPLPCTHRLHLSSPMRSGAVEGSGLFGG